MAQSWPRDSQIAVKKGRKGFLITTLFCTLSCFCVLTLSTMILYSLCELSIYGYADCLLPYMQSA